MFFENFINLSIPESTKLTIGQNENLAAGFLEDLAFAVNL